MSKVKKKQGKAQPKTQSKKVVNKAVKKSALDIVQGERVNKERENKGAPLEAGSADMIGGIDEVIIEAGQSKVCAHKTMDALDHLLKNKTITKSQYAAGRKYEYYYLGASKSEVKGLDPDYVAGYSEYSALDIRIHARRQVEAAHAAIGGASSLTVLALHSIAVRKCSLSEMVKHYKHPVHFWRGMFVSALEKLESHFDGR